MTRSKDGKRPKRSGREVLDRKRPVEHEVKIALESHYADTLAEAQGAMERLERDLRLGRITTEQFQLEGPKLQDQVDAAQAEYDENAVTFRAKALGRRKLDDLMKVHEPTDEQKAAFRELVDRAPLSARNGELPYNTETLPPALLHLSLVEPEFSADEAQELWDSDDWSDAELGAILNACWAVNKMIK
jgi:hypothetical protein